MKRIHIKRLCLITLLLIAGGTSCRFVMPERSATYNGGRVNVDLPNGPLSAESDSNIDKETSVVISLPDDNNIFIGKSRTPISKDDLRSRLMQLLKDRSGSEELVYIAAGKSDSYGTIVGLLDELRRQSATRVGLIANRRRGDNPSRFAVQIPDEPDPSQDLSNAKPNPLTLVVSVTRELNLKLNQDACGNIDDTGPLSAKLLEIFQARFEQHAYKPGLELRTDLPESERIEKTLIIKGTRSLKYGDVIKLIDAVKSAGANPLVLQIDDLSP